MNFFIDYKLYAHNWELNFQSSHSPMVDGIILMHHETMTYIITIIIIILYTLVRPLQIFKHNYYYYLISNNNNYKIQKSDFKKFGFMQYYLEELIELLWTIIPLMILIYIGFLIISLIHNIDNYIYLPSYTIDVIGQQWYWTYNYNEFNLKLNSYLIPEDYLQIGELRLLEVDNRLILPSKTHIRLLVTSEDVIHSWSIPSIGIKVDANPGRLNHCHIYIYNSGIFYGQCSELCGLGHNYMPIVIQAVPLYYFKYIIFNL